MKLKLSGHDAEIDKRLKYGCKIYKVKIHKNHGDIAYQLSGLRLLGYFVDGGDEDDDSWHPLLTAQSANKETAVEFAYVPPFHSISNSIASLLGLRKLTDSLRHALPCNRTNLASEVATDADDSGSLAKATAVRDYLRKLCLQDQDAKGATQWTQFHFDVVDGNVDAVDKAFRGCKTNEERDALEAVQNWRRETAKDLAFDKGVRTIFDIWNRKAQHTDLIRAVLRNDEKEVEKILKSNRKKLLESKEKLDAAAASAGTGSIKDVADMYDWKVDAENADGKTALDLATGKKVPELLYAFGAGGWTSFLSDIAKGRNTADDNAIKAHDNDFATWVDEELQEAAKQTTDSDAQENKSDFGKWPWHQIEVGSSPNSPLKAVKLRNNGRYRNVALPRYVLALVLSQPKHKQVMEKSETHAMPRSSFPFSTAVNT